MVLGPTRLRVWHLSEDEKPAGLLGGGAGAFGESLQVTVSALKSLLAAQFPNGAWPHVYTKPADKKPILKANYAPDGNYLRIKNYWD